MRFPTIPTFFIAIAAASTQAAPVAIPLFNATTTLGDALNATTTTTTPGALNATTPAFNSSIPIIPITNSSTAVRSNDTRQATRNRHIFLTSSDLKQNAMTDVTNATSSNNADVTISTTNKTFQAVHGFGASMTEASAYLLSNLDKSTQDDVMQKLFSTSNGIGLNFLRQPMGTSDLSMPYHFFSYVSQSKSSKGKRARDVAKQLSLSKSSKGKRAMDVAKQFSLSGDEQYVLPMLQKAVSVNPDIAVLGTPWSPPASFKSGNSMNGSTGGVLKEASYDNYAQYFVSFVNQYKAAGVPVWGVTMQNEPLYAPNGYPGMNFPSSSAATFLGQHLGPAFKNANLDTKVLIYDHNFDNATYPSDILSDDTAKQFVGGVGWHCYGGSASDAMPSISQQFPGVSQHLTECSGGSWEGSNGEQDGPAAFESFINTAMSVMTNGGSSLVRWGLALDESGGPNLGTGASCNNCRGVVTIPQGGNQPAKMNTDYYVLGHFSKFVQRGALRVQSKTSGDSSDLQQVAFMNPDGSMALVAYNGGGSDKTIKVQTSGTPMIVTVPSKNIASVTW